MSTPRAAVVLAQSVAQKTALSNQNKLLQMRINKLQAEAARESEDVRRCLQLTAKRVDEAKKLASHAKALSQAAQGSTPGVANGAA